MALEFNDLREEQKQIVEAIGVENYLKLTREFGGTTIYIAKAEEIIRRNERDGQIREEFNGSNYAQLAVKYGLSEVWIRNIVSEKAAGIRQRPIDGQMSIMDYL